MKLGRQRQELERDRSELASRQAQLADHIDRAAKAADNATVQDLVIEIGDVEHKLEETCWLLELLEHA